MTSQATISFTVESTVTPVPVFVNPVINTNISRSEGLTHIVVLVVVVVGSSTISITSPSRSQGP